MTASCIIAWILGLPTCWGRNVTRSFVSNSGLACTECRLRQAVLREDKKEAPSLTRPDKRPKAQEEQEDTRRGRTEPARLYPQRALTAKG